MYVFFIGECFLPTTISNLKLIRRDSGGNTSNFNTVLRCKDGFSPVDDWMAVCSNGSWIPDLDEIECHNITAVIPSKALNKNSLFPILLNEIYR